MFKDSSAKNFQSNPSRLMVSVGVGYHGESVTAGTTGDRRYDEEEAPW